MQLEYITSDQQEAILAQVKASCPAFSEVANADLWRNVYFATLKLSKLTCWNDASVEFYQDNGSWWTREYKRSVPNQYNSIATQTLTAINTATPVTFATTEMGSADFSHVVSSIFECENPGTYMFDAQLQVRDTSVLNNTVYACYQLYNPGTTSWNGIQYASSKATLGLLTLNEEITLGITRTIRLQKNDLVRLVFGASSTAIQLASTSSPFVGVSDVPSATIRISRVTTNT